MRLQLVSAGAGSANTSSDEAAVAFFLASAAPSSPTPARPSPVPLLSPPAGAGSSASVPAGPLGPPGQGDQASLERRRRRSRCCPRRPHPPLALQGELHGDPAPQTAVSSARSCGPRRPAPRPPGPRSIGGPFRPAVAQQEEPARTGTELPVVLVAARVKAFNSERSSTVSVTR